ncbi:MAG: histidine kinase [Clostridiales bacterium]|nr:histidine kinase [Clostridiales bacterium]
MRERLQHKKHLFFHIFNGLSDSASFKRRLFMSFLLIALPVITGVSVIAIIIIQVSSQTIVEQTQATELEKTAAQLESIFSDTENMSREIVYNSAIQEYVSEAAESESYPEDSNVSYYINGLILNREYIDCVVVISADRTLYSTENAYSDRSAFQNITEKWWYGDLTTSSDSCLWFPYSRLSAATYESQLNNEIVQQINTLMLARPIYSTSDYSTVMGYLMIYLSDEYMEQLWQDISWGRTSNLFLYNADGELILANSRMNDYSEIFESVNYTAGNQVFRYDRELYVLSRTELGINSWTLYMLTPYSETTNNSRIMTAILFSVVGAIVLALFLMSKYSANNMSRPVISLSKLMDAYHGADQDLDPAAIQRYQNRSDEIGQMYRSYEQLENRMNRLIQEIYVKNLEKKDAELALLQTQINPHFLYNTLDSINWIALANGQDEISDMITALSDTFRLSLMKSNSSFIEMDQEVRYIQSYLVLQKFRYADRLEYDFDLPEDTSSLYIPRFILQPVVENSLKHGIDRLPNGGRISIHIAVSDQIIIEVINDGNDIDLEKMKNILVFHPEDSDILNFKKEGYGVQNIHRRIKIICGDPYGLSYSATFRQTICRITLPVKRTLEDTRPRETEAPGVR